MKKIKYTLIKLFGIPNEKYDYLYHFYRKGKIPFHTITDLDFSNPAQYAEYAFQNHLVKKGYFDREYFERRLVYESIMRRQFVDIGGEPRKNHPYYCTLGYGKMFNLHRNKDFVRIPIDWVNLKTVSFTYGDSFPTFNIENCGFQKEYYGRIYDYNGIMKIISKYGKPDRKNMYETYIEAQVWDDDIIRFFN